MKYYFLAICLLASLTATASEKTYVFTNSEGCTVNISTLSTYQYIDIHLSQFANNDTEQATLKLHKNMTDADLLSHCPGDGHDSKVIADNNSLNIQCNSNDEKDVTSLESNLTFSEDFAPSLTQLNYVSSHGHIDQIICTDLQHTQTIEH